VTNRLGRRAAPVEAIIEDAEGAVWLGPRLRIDPERWTAREFGPADGAEFQNFFIASRSRMGDGRLLFGSPEGLLVVRPRDLRDWTFAPRVAATSLQVDGAPRPISSALTLASSERGFRLDFASLDFTAPQRNLYRYRLEGYDLAWISADATQRSLTYTNLSPGNYTLRVQSTNRARVWSPHELRIPVTVLPAFYETGWFRASCVALAVAMAYAAYRLRIRRLSLRALELQRQVDERTAELRTAYARIEEASLTDPLTGLRNRRFLEREIGADLELASRGHGDLIVLLCDLDHFKSVNDTYGHAAGDAVLAATAETLRKALRVSDYAVRWGGEELLAVARFIDRREASKIAEKVRAAIAEQEIVLDDGTQLGCTCSIGVAAWPSGNLSWEQVIHLADEALYEAKQSGRNRVCAAAADEAPAIR
jgi:diguanylate cyclase (GGDEF)-like protein